MSNIEIKKISITNIQADCIVNAANNGLWQGGGVCGAIFKAAGASQLTKACNKIGSCETGNAVITPAFKLSARHIIHAVGPKWIDGKHGEPSQLYDAYENSLELAKTHNCHSIAFPLISAGIFGYPLKSAWRKAIQSTLNFINKNPDYDISITFAVLDDHIISVGQKILDELKNGKSITHTSKDSADFKPTFGKTSTVPSLVEVFKNTLKMCEEDSDLLDATRNMQNGSILYFDQYESPFHEVKGNLSNIQVVEDTTFSCAFKNIQKGKVAVLNFANAVNPGGGVQKGSKAQEEGLCRSSNLYLGLDLPYFRKHYYDVNRDKGQSIGTDALLYHPGVTVFKDDNLCPNLLPKEQWFQTDVITCAAPRIYPGTHMSNEKIKEIHIQRGKNILEAAIANKVDVLILGAFGCGAFHNPPEIVAEAYRILLIDQGYCYYFKKIIFAIKKDHNDKKGNYQKFKEILAPDIKIVKKSDWTTNPMPKLHRNFSMKRHFEKDELGQLRLGHIPEEMEDKWFWYMEGDTLYCHRSWTGNCIYIVKINTDSDEMYVTVNQDPEQYSDDNLDTCASTLNNLLNWWTHSDYDYYSEWLFEIEKDLSNDEDNQ